MYADLSAGVAVAHSVTSTGPLLAVVLTAAVASYLLGALSPATIAARRAGADLRQYGSGNPGATNVTRALGRRAGVLVALVDVVKGLLPAVAFGAIDERAGLVAGVAAVLGHVTSPFLHGHGGKGVATAFGAVLGSHPVWALIALGVWILVVAAARWVALASMSAAAAMVVCAAVGGAHAASVAWAVALALIVLVRHTGNVRRRWAARRSAGEPPDIAAP